MINVLTLYADPVKTNVEQEGKPEESKMVGLTTNTAFSHGNAFLSQVLQWPVLGQRIMLPISYCIQKGYLSGQFAYPTSVELISRRTGDLYE